MTATAKDTDRVEVPPYVRDHAVAFRSALREYLAVVEAQPAAGAPDYEHASWRGNVDRARTR